jgi:hypothetical protein
MASDERIAAIEARDREYWPYVEATIADRRQHAPSLPDDSNLSAHEDRHYLLARLREALDEAAFWKEEVRLRDKRASHNADLQP